MAVTAPRGARGAVASSCVWGCVAALLAAGAQAADPGALALQGRISADVGYRLRIDYVTSANDRSCQFSDYITGMWDPKVESRYEKPDVQGERHSLRIALEHPGGAGACGWRPSVISLCVGPRGAAEEPLACTPLFLVRDDAEPAPAAIGLACDPTSWVCVDSSGQAPARQVSSFGQPITLDLVAKPLR